MSVCPVCKHRITNGANKTKREGVRFHKTCVVSLKSWRARQKRIRKEKRGVAFKILYPAIVPKTSPIKRLYQIFKERAGLSKPDTAM